MNSVTSAQLQPSSARANTCACTRAPSQQADAFVVARLLQLRNRTRCSSCWVPWVFWVRGDKWRVSSSRPSRLPDVPFASTLRSSKCQVVVVVVVIPLQFSSVTTAPFSDNDPSLVTSPREKRHAHDLLSAHVALPLAGPFPPHFSSLANHAPQIMALV